MNPKNLSPLRYPGGKSKFSPYISSVIKSNSLTGGHYLEAYAGGAGVAINLLFNKVVSHVHINDVDPAINMFWKAAIYDTDNLTNLIFSTPINMEQWFYWRDVMNGNVKCTPTEIGFATLFMNRTNRSGILKGGVIGGKNQNGNYSLGDRFIKERIAERIKKISSFREQISVYSLDAYDLLNQCSRLVPKNTLIYLDPPYYVKGQGLYRNFYNHEDHLAISEKLQSKDFQYKWIVSYDNAPQIHEMYSNCQHLNYKLRYTAQKNYAGEEIMFFSKDTALPQQTEHIL